MIKGKSNLIVAGAAYRQAVAVAFIFMPAVAMASIESSLSNVENKLTHVILPVLSVIGIAWAAFSLMTGNERAKQHLMYAIIGSAIGFGAQAIVDFISQSVR